MNKIRYLLAFIIYGVWLIYMAFIVIFKGSIAGIPFFQFNFLLVSTIVFPIIIFYQYIKNAGDLKETSNFAYAAIIGTTFILFSGQLVNTIETVSRIIQGS
ncbi:hypothetical protein ACFFIX_19620 [Metabacillus herbersteinensis]|uniref:CPBP family intramembrane metalloprotease n=1 Tax=Metabacillus herbersteinensis TaxID=283816 RepID=A0ABV6GIU7_9BACI